MPRPASKREFQTMLHEKLTKGKRISVKLNVGKKSYWYDGAIVKSNKSTCKHTVKYDDGDTLTHDFLHLLDSGIEEWNVDA